MTIVFSVASPNIILMTADSAITHIFEDHQEYDTGRKFCYFPGVGCVTTWGSRDFNHVGRYLGDQNISPDTHTIEDLANIVYLYLTEEYRPNEHDLDDVGYHVGGFDRIGRPKLYHVFYGFDRPRPIDQTSRKYSKYDHSPTPPRMFFLYNGRNDLAHILVNTLLWNIQQNNPTRFRLESPVDLVSFSDFVARFASEITPEVGPPFISLLINPNNEISRISNDTLSPIDKGRILDILTQLGYETVR